MFSAGGDRYLVQFCWYTKYSISSLRPALWESIGLTCLSTDGNVRPLGTPSLQRIATVENTACCVSGITFSSKIPAAENHFVYHFLARRRVLFCSTSNGTLYSHECPLRFKMQNPCHIMRSGALPIYVSEGRQTTAGFQELRVRRALALTIPQKTQREAGAIMYGGIE